MLAPESGVVEVFNNSGAWPDGAAVVKGIRSLETGALTAGIACYAGDGGVGAC